MTDREVGEFLLRELLSEVSKHSYPVGWDYVVSCWSWSGAIIEAMRERGFYFSGLESYNGGAWEFLSVTRGGLIVSGQLTPRTVALAAAKALGMEVSE